MTNLASSILEREAFASYVFCAALLGFKLLFMSVFTSFLRLKNKTFANPEDRALFRVKAKLNDQQVERVRRVHLNDLENIPAFWILGFLYVTTDPSPIVAFLVFFSYVASRFWHTFVFMRGILDTRPIAYIAGASINVYMSVSTLYFYY